MTIRNGSDVNGYNIRKDVASGMAVLSRNDWDNEVAFGGAPAIQAYAKENPDVPKAVIDKLLAVDAEDAMARLKNLEADSHYVVETATDRIVSGPFERIGEIPLGLMGYDGAHKVKTGREIQEEAAAAAPQELSSSGDRGASPGKNAGAGSSLPDFCFVFIPEGGPGKYVGAVRLGEMGYSPTTYDVADPETARELVAHVNKRLGVTDIQAQCMHNGSMFGWDTPGANPEHMAKLLKGKPLKSSALDDLTPLQRSALLSFREKHGRNWKSSLLDGWRRAAFPGELQQIRNQFGPVWLNGLKPADFERSPPEYFYGMLRDCSPENATFLASIDGVVVGKPDTENPERFLHVCLTPEALGKVREFAADFQFESLISSAERGSGVAETATMSDTNLAAEAAYLHWQMHSGEVLDAATVDRHASIMNEVRDRFRKVAGLPEVSTTEPELAFSPA